MAKWIAFPPHGKNTSPCHATHIIWRIGIMRAIIGLMVATRPRWYGTAAAAVRPLRQLIGRATAQEKNGEYEQEKWKNACCLHCD